MIEQLQNYLLVGAGLFVLGLLGFLIKRNVIVMFLSAELMLQGVAVNLLAFSNFHNNYQGHAFTIFVLTVAACEAGLAMALFVVLYNRRKTLDVHAWNSLAEVDAEWFDAPADGDQVLVPDVSDNPKLAVAGRPPALTQERGKPNA